MDCHVRAGDVFDKRRYKHADSCKRVTTHKPPCMRTRKGRDMPRSVPLKQSARTSFFLLFEVEGKKVKLELLEGRGGGARSFPSALTKDEAKRLERLMPR